MNFLKRFIAAAVALVMVLALVPAGALVANAAEVTYVLESSAMTSFAEKTKADGETETAGTNNFFTLHWGNKTKIDSSNKTFSDGYKSGQRINWGGKSVISATPSYCASFTTGGSAVVKVWWVSGGDGREIAIYDASGAVVANTVASESVKNSLYISELTLSDAGSYYMGSTTGSNYWFKVEVTVSEGHTHEYSTVVTAPTCEEQGYTTYTCTVADCGYSYDGDYVDATGHSYGEDGYCVCGRCEHAVDTTYTFVPTELTAAADKEAVEDGAKLGTNGFFTANVEAAAEGEDPNMTKRYSSSKGVYAVELGKGGSGTISFTLTGTADVTVLAASTGGDNVSDLTLVDEYGTTVAEDNGVTTVTGTGNAAFTYSDLAAGTYYLTNPGTARNTRVASIEVIETVSAGCEHNPIMVNFTMNAGYTAGTATVTAPVGTTYYQAYGIGGMELTINGGEPTALPTVMGRQPVIFTITNDGEAAAEYALAVAMPAPSAGTMENPEILEELSWSFIDVSLEAGDIDGYYYQFTAPADGSLTLYFSYLPEGVEADIAVFNNSTYASRSLLYDGVDNYGLELQLEVSKGDVLDIQIVVLPDASWAIPAADITWVGNFVYPEGTQQNPIVIEWEWNDVWSAASAEVSVPAGETLYFAGEAGMDLTVNGVETEMTEMGVFSITNAGEAEATYTLEMTTPLGQMGNPEVLTSIESFGASVEKDNWFGYHFSYTPDFNGTISLSIASITEGVEGDIVVTNQVTYAQSSLAYEGVDGVLTVEVTKGQELIIQVMSRPDENWSLPAADITVAGKAEVEAEPVPELFNLAGANLELANDITMYFYVNAADVADGYYMEIVKTNADGSKVTKTVAKADWTAYGTTMYYVGFNGMAAKEMADEIAVTVYNAEGTQVSNTTTTSISAYALRALDNAAYASMHTMMADLLNYGAAAQNFFKYNTSNLANANMTETHQSYATKGFDMSKYTNDVVVGTGVVGANLSLETNILQNFYFDPAVVDSTMTAKVTYTNYKGVEKTARISGDKFGTMPGYGYIIVEVSVLVPADVMSLVSVEIVNAEGTVVASVSDSISSYAVRANTNSPDALYIELMEYCLSCEAYFG